MRTEQKPRLPVVGTRVALSEDSHSAGVKSFSPDPQVTIRCNFNVLHVFVSYKIYILKIRIILGITFPLDTHYTGRMRSNSNIITSILMIL